MKARRNYGLCDWFSWTDLSAVSLVRGGGLVLLPAMVSFLKVDDYKARGTTLATIFIATLVAAIFYSREIKFSFVEEDFVFENDITIPLKKIYATVKFL